MKHLLRLLPLAAGLLLAHASLPAQEVSPAKAKRIDSLFASYRAPNTPGCALGIYRDGRVIFAKGYGTADLEHAVPIVPWTVFDIGSTSKQFTAAALILLAEDGKLSLDDDVRKYIPELPDYGHVITLRQLLHHTAGVRDYLGLMVMSGIDREDLATMDDALRIITHQRGLDFEPGTKHAYSNSGYILAAEVVRRVSGKSLRAFTTERIFAPLSMTHTLFADDHTMIIRNRAIGYEEGDDKALHRSMNMIEAAGDGLLHTTVEDLSRWDRNFIDMTVGGQELIREMLRPAVLSNGDTVPYGGGLEFGTFRGVKIVEHEGANAGYRADLLRIPSEHLSVAILANCRSIDPGALCRKVAEIVLGDRLPAKASVTASATPPPPPVSYPYDATRFDTLVGDYEMEESPGFIFTFLRDGGQFYVRGNGQPLQQIIPASDSVFFPDAEVKFVFGRSPVDGVPTVAYVENGVSHTGRRVTLDTTPPVLSTFVGTYRSPELGTVYTVTVEGAKLVARHERRGAVTLTPKRTGGAPLFAGSDWLLRRVIFEPGADGRPRAMLVSFARNKDIRFERVE